MSLLQTRVGIVHRLRSDHRVFVNENESTESIGPPMDKLSNDASPSELTSPNSCTIFSQPINKYDYIRSAKCPLCTQPDEDRDHILRCPHTTRRSWPPVLFNAIRERREKLRTRPVLTEILLEGIAA